MTKSSVSDWDTTAANNTDVGGIAVSNAQTVDKVDDIVREMMAQIAAAGFTSATTLGPVIAAATGKTTPIDADSLVISDSASAGATKKVLFSNLRTWVGAALGPVIATITGKTTVVDADWFVISDSAAANVSKSHTFANLKASLKAYFDTLYVITPWVAYTPTFTGFGTVSAINFRSRIVGNTLEVMGTFTPGTTTATEARITLGSNGTSANVSVDSTLGTRTAVGGVAFNTAFAGSGVVLVEASQTFMCLGLQTATTNSSYVKAAGNVFTSAVTLSIFANIPLT